MSTKGKISLIACDSGKIFAEKIHSSLKDIFRKKEIKDGPVIRESKEIYFLNTEIKTEILESIRGEDVYVIQDVENKITRLSVDQNLMALKTAIDAARRSDAHYITAVIPVFPYARQDKQISRESITAALVAREIENAGANKIITMDVHNNAIAGFFRKATFENLHASKNHTDYVKENLDCTNLVVASPDVGGFSRAKHYARILQKSMITLYKQKDYSDTSDNKIKNTYLLGEVKGKDVLIVDDMIDTAGTIIEAAKKLKENGAEKIYAACGLPVFSLNAVDKLEGAIKEGILEKVIGTDAVTHPPSLRAKPWYVEVSVAKYFAKVIFNLNHYKPISELLK